MPSEVEKVMDTKTPILRNRKNKKNGTVDSNLARGTSASTLTRKPVLVESSLLLFAVFWCSVELRKTGVLVNEATALMALGVLSLVARFTAGLPKSWISASRSCPDSGLLYGILLVPMTQAIRILLRDPIRHPERFEYDTIWYWISVGNSMYCLMQMWFGTRLLVQACYVPAVVAWVTGSWLVSNPQNIGNGPDNVPWYFFLPTMSLYVFTETVAFGKIYRVFNSTLKHSFTIGEGQFVAQGISICLLDFLGYSLATIFPRTSWKGWMVIDATGDKRTIPYVALQGGLLGILLTALPLSPILLKYAKPLHLRSAKSSTNKTSPTTTTPTTLGSTDNPNGTAIESLPGIAVVQWDTLPVRDTVHFYVTVCLFLAVVTSTWLEYLIERHPVVWVLEFTFSSPSHINLVAFWLAILGIGLPLIHMVTASNKIPLIIVRKLYHILALFMFSPALLYARDFMSLAFGVAIGALLLVEYARMCTVPPIGKWMNQYMQSYTDSRDEGIVILTHFYLLCGCATPVWLSKEFTNSLAPYAGLLILGAGDAAGAIVGSSIGRLHWPGSRKTVEGTISAIASTLLMSFVLHLFAEEPLLLFGTTKWAKVLLATSLTCLLEAFTNQIDNLVLPIYYMILLGLASL